MRRGAAQTRARKSASILPIEGTPLVQTDVFLETLESDRVSARMPQSSIQPGRSSACAHRLRSATLTVEPSSGFRVRIEVEVGGRLGVAEVRGFGSEAVELRLAAEATLAALRKASEGRIELRLVGIKRLRAFDANAVLVSLAANGDDGSQLVGAVPLDGNTAEGAALAVLGALGNHAASARPALEPALALPGRDSA